MAIVRWNPWDTMQLSQVFDDNNVFDQNFNQMTRVNVSEDKENVYVEMTLAGFTEEDIKVTVEGSSLTVKAEANEKEESKGKKYYRREITSNSVVRSITLPTHVASDKASAEFENGILTLTLPKAEEAKPKEIIVGKSK